MKAIARFGFAILRQANKVNKKNKNHTNRKCLQFFHSNES